MEMPDQDLLVVERALVDARRASSAIWVPESMPASCRANSFNMTDGGLVRDAFVHGPRPVGSTAAPRTDACRGEVGQ